MQDGGAGGSGGGGDGGGDGGGRGDKPVVAGGDEPVVAGGDEPVVAKFIPTKRGRGESLMLDDRQQRSGRYGGGWGGGYAAPRRGADSWERNPAGGGAPVIGEVKTWGTKATPRPTNESWLRNTGGDEGSGGGGGNVQGADTNPTISPPGATVADGGSGGGGNARGADTAPTIIPPGGAPREGTIPFHLTETSMTKRQGAMDLRVDCKAMPDTEWERRIMLEVHHTNVLRIEAQYGPGGVVMQHVDGGLKSYIKLECLKGQNSFDFLKDIIRQLLQGVTEIALSGYYHGNIGGGRALLYTVTQDGSVVVKLAHFQQKFNFDGEGYELIDGVREDFHDIGSWVFDLVKELEKIIMKSGKSADSSEIKDLVTLLKSFKSKDLNPREMLDSALANLYFWSPPKRSSFYAFKVSHWLMTSEEFKEKVKTQLSCPDPWDTNKQCNGYYGLVDAMNEHRKKKLGIGPYHGKSSFDYLRFVCGSYTHEGQLLDERKISHKTETVDGVFRECHLDLTVRVMKLAKICKLT